MEATMPWVSLEGKDADVMNSAMRELEHDSDRAAGLVGAVFVEESLTALVQSRMYRDKDTVDELYRPSGPLGALSVKIDLGFLLGLYTEAARKELETIKNIRNEFAHYIARDFAYGRIRDLTNNLTIAERTDFFVSGVPDRGQLVFFVGSKPPADHPNAVPLLAPMEPDKIRPRDRYLRACQFYTAGLLFSAHAIPLANSPAFF